MKACDICGLIAESVTFCDLCQKSLCPDCKSNLSLRVGAALNEMLKKVMRGK